ncbi:transcription elongation factor spt5 [Didymosphaeria variabile]|uniref:Transcription elongation factor spt5 n=1 Tax=Didymosphaeria variabile TaxID=1932322 RepID=A0A9W8XVC6_9PLEO|nr:transcription elongation factor spt5 [Didymosphaeria variabile]KAJ4358473.1 transcription elongation factor spt5 [Didymosphaeria variabile]
MADPKKPSPTTSRGLTDPSISSEASPSSGIPWPAGQIPLHFRTKEGDGARGDSISASSDGVQDSSEISEPLSRNVDFITYGRSEFSNISMGTLLNDKEEYSRNQSLMEQTLNQSRTKTALDEVVTEIFSPAAQAAEVYHLHNYLNDIAHVLVRYLDDMMDAGDIDSKYNVVLRYDAIMRGLCIEKMPPWLSLNMPYNDAWPEWTKWVRRSYHASCAHKIIMIHQSFLGRSFKDPRYTYSRWACISSAKTVLEAMEKRLPKEPQWWVEQAFVVTAGLCLGLDLFHRSEGEPEAIKDLEAIQKAVTILEQWPTSSVAAHGIRLLSTLLQEHSKRTDATRADSRTKEPDLPPNIAPQALAHDASVDSPKPSEALPPPHESLGPTEVPIGEEVWANTDFDIDMTGFEELMDTLPLQNGFDNSVFLDSLWNGYTVRRQLEEVICVGPSRSGTDSLKQALLELGYPRVFHGYETMLTSNRHQKPVLSRLTEKKYHSDSKSGDVTFTAEEFDQVFGEYDALTDMPCATFAAELVAAYPDAKIILNRRSNVDAWYKSFDATLMANRKEWWSYTCSWFSPDLYWSKRLVHRQIMPEFFRGDFQANGKWVGA